MSKRKTKSKYSLLKALICCAFFAYVGYTLVSQQFAINAKKAELNSINMQISQAKTEKEELKKQKKTVNTPEFIEKVAREELGYAAPDEIIFMDATAQN